MEYRPNLSAIWRSLFTECSFSQFARRVPSYILKLSFGDNLTGSGYCDRFLDVELLPAIVYGVIIEYWVVNLKKRQLIIFRQPSDAEYASKSTVTKGTIYPLTFPDVTISVDMTVSN
ncbi:MAG: hypothetical protein ACFCUV_08700 [Rivularia sp. (in: cyanobacteria)]